MQVRRLHHVSVTVDDLDGALDFYVGKLGATVRVDRPDLGFRGAWLDLGEGQLHLIEGVTGTPDGAHFALEVDDLDAAIGALRARGTTISDPVAIGSARQAFCEDPSGNRVELHQVR